MINGTRKFICLWLALMLCVAPLRFALAEGWCADDDGEDSLRRTASLGLDMHDHGAAHSGHGLGETPEFAEDHEHGNQVPHCAPGHACPAIAAGAVLQACCTVSIVPETVPLLHSILIVHFPIRPPCV